MICQITFKPFKCVTADSIREQFLMQIIILADSLNQFKNKLDFFRSIKLTNMKLPLNMIRY